MQNDFRGSTSGSMAVLWALSSTRTLQHSYQQCCSAQNTCQQCHSVQRSDQRSCCAWHSHERFAQQCGKFQRSVRPSCNHCRDAQLSSWCLAAQRSAISSMQLHTLVVISSEAVLSTPIINAQFEALWPAALSLAALYPGGLLHLVFRVPVHSAQCPIPNAW